MNKKTGYIVEVPSNIKQENYRFFVVSNYCYFLGLLLHICFLVLFYFFNIIPLVLFNIISCAVFFICFYINRKGFHYLSVFSVCIEVIFHSILCSYYIGWNSGFHYYILAIIPLVFLLPRFSFISKSSITILFLFCYIGQNYYSLHLKIHKFLLDENILSFFNYFNITSTVVLLSLIGYLYNKAAVTAEEALEKHAKIDSLTQLANRRYYDLYIHDEWLRLKREKKVLSIIFIDIDFFKLYNDYYGHLAGDKCIKCVAFVLKKIIHRPSDLAARYGGEEFIITLPDTPLEGARKLAQLIQEELKKLQIPHDKSKVNQYLTCSIGVVSAIPDSNNSIEKIVEIADKAMYEAKQQGRNRILCVDSINIIS